MIPKISVLDHGYVTFIEKWGSDMRIIEAARMSTDKGFLGWEAEFHYKCADCHYSCAVIVDPLNLETERCHCGGKFVEQEDKSHKGDAKLLSFLYKHHHMSPFEFGGMVIEVQAPIFVFREWHRHRTQSYNEMSARYTPLPDVNYVPTVERLLMKSTKNKQAQAVAGAYELDEQQAELWLSSLKEVYERAESLYKCGLDWGIPKELARLIMPVGRYSRMRASANLRNWLLFLTLRMDENAQWEIRQYANVVAGIIESAFPRTYELFVKGRG